MSDPDVKKLQYDIIANQINREDELISKRLTWTLTINGFLFAALGFLAGKNQPHQAILELFQIALPLTGIAISVAGLLGVVAAYIQIQYLTEQWVSLDDPRWVRPFGDKKHAFVLGFIPCISPPVVLIVVWTGLLWVWR